jgi:hypothetical protein
MSPLRTHRSAIRSSLLLAVVFAVACQVGIVLLAMSNAVAPVFTSSMAMTLAQRSEMARRSGLPPDLLERYTFPLIALNWNQLVSTTTQIRSGNGLDSSVMIWCSRAGWPFDIVRDHTVTNSPNPPSGALSHWYNPATKRAVSPTADDLASYTFRLHWPGFVVNTVLFSLPAFAVVLLVRSLIVFRKRERGLCHHCGYSLQGVRSALCPECGCVPPPS